MSFTRKTNSRPAAWPLHDTAITNTVWCVAYNRGVEGGGGRILRTSHAIVWQSCGQCRWGGYKNDCFVHTKPRSKRISCRDEPAARLHSVPQVKGVLQLRSKRYA